ncbi:hypothetical protein PF005_g12904 [Phytophthora fragariae]|uniref:Uncharacterized protein n=1 Tax=Phytophthora fragariae TaxID=53985 RepID=A0A6A3TX26_9STRA|nr:hypothetical protein PF009_g14095 [Phytophthora fragariae]KAE9005750.1 hypothetical protein PF011_g11892 [Phytophthora fragariae]KAE9106727.1 hypothetical protein PF010_g12516 [Phytophthora fragariae]KAE9106964.1 hypothetical protein PF007_g13203 [Phytophthora fragariae]KAE9142865.1 hypothetical protein PF006_g12056 [Phytophthora fragariae]
MVHVHPAARRCSKRLPKSHLSGLPLQDVVVQWVLRPGNYQRWRQGRKKKIAGEILAELEAVGCRGPDATDVVCMVESIEKQYVNLARWIQKNEIRASDLLRGEVDEKACSKAKKICPSYCDLVPVFHEFNFDIEVHSSSSSSPSSSSSAREDKANGDEAEEKEEKEDDVKEVEDKEDKEDDVTEVEANEDKAGTVAPEKVDATAGHKRSIEEISQYRPLSSVPNH